MGCCVVLFVLRLILNFFHKMEHTMCFVLELQLKVKYLFKICYFKTLKRALKYCLFINFSNLFVHYIYLFYTDIVISFQLN